MIEEKLNCNEILSKKLFLKCEVGLILQSKVDFTQNFHYVFMSISDFSFKSILKFNLHYYLENRQQQFKNI